MQRLSKAKELKLIFLLAKTLPTQNQLQGAQLLVNSTLNWESVFKISNSLSISSLLYYNLNNLPNASKIIPNYANIWLKASYQSSLAQNLKLWTEFLRVKDEFKKIGAESIPLKGLIFIHSLYHKFGLRKNIDIDIFIKEADLIACIDKLIQLGYQKKEFISLAYRLKYHCHISFFNQGKNVLLELHWAFAPPRPNKIDLTEVWQRAKKQKIDDLEVLTLSPEDALLSLCINMCRNIPNLEFIPFKNLVDINELISQNKDKLDFNYLTNKINQWRLKGEIYYLYFLTATYLDTPWPEDFISKIRIPVLQKKALNLFPLTLTKRSQFAAIILMAFMLDNLSDVIRLIFRLISQASSIFTQNKRLFSSYLKR